MNSYMHGSDPIQTFVNGMNVGDLLDWLRYYRAQLIALRNMANKGAPHYEIEALCTETLNEGAK